MRELLLRHEKATDAMIHRLDQGTQEMGALPPTRALSGPLTASIRAAGRCWRIR